MVHTCLPLRSSGTGDILGSDAAFSAGIPTGPQTLRHIDLPGQLPTEDTMYRGVPTTWTLRYLALHRLLLATILRVILQILGKPVQLRVVGLMRR